MILFYIPTNGVDFSDPFNQCELRFYDPVVYLAKRHCIVRLTVFLHGILLGSQGIHVDFAQPSSDRSHFRL